MEPTAIMTNPEINVNKPIIPSPNPETIIPRPETDVIIPKIAEAATPIQNMILMIVGVIMTSKFIYFLNFPPCPCRELDADGAAFSRTGGVAVGGAEVFGVSSDTLIASTAR